MSSIGLIERLEKESLDLFSRLITPKKRLSLPGLSCTIVHANPHLDEYVGDVLFRCCLEDSLRGVPFREQVIFSTTDDLLIQDLWPSAAVFGIPEAAQSATALRSFDEHSASSGKGSACQIVEEQLIASLRPSVRQLLEEVSLIDEFGGAHPQSLHNVTKGLHAIHLTVGSGASKQCDRIPVRWKRAVVVACMAAVVHCLEEGFDLIGDSRSKKKILLDSLSHYANNSAHSGRPRFARAVDWIRSTFGNQAEVFRNAVLCDRKGPIKRGGAKVPQLLVLGRVIPACGTFWGETIRDAIGMLLWDQVVQGQLAFREVSEVLEESLRTCGQDFSISSPIGELTRVRVAYRQQQALVLGLSPRPGLLAPHRALIRHMNTHAQRCGLVLIQDRSLGTNALFRGTEIRQADWDQMMDGLEAAEPECWHSVRDSAGVRGSFAVNGNEAHRYKPRSNISPDVVVAMLEGR